jgi:hypothetical protein
MKKITIEKGLVSLINHNVKAKCPERRIVIDLETMQIKTHPTFTDSEHHGNWIKETETGEIICGELELYDENGGAIGYNTVSRKSLIDAAKRELSENGIDYKEA